MTDDELAEMIEAAWFGVVGGPKTKSANVLTRIRRPLEARGIGMAASWHTAEAEKTMSGITPYSSLRHDVELAEAATDHELAAEALESLARQHAAGEDGK